MSTAVATVDNPFGPKHPPTAMSNSLAHSEAERAIQEVQASMVIAKQFPRDSIKAMERILNACTRETLANTALYSYPRGGQDVTGPSIRLAEALVQEWGNIQFGIRELSSRDGVSTVEAYAWDVETNTRQVKTFQVPHVRHSRKGTTRLTDPRDIYEMVANQGARRLRTCILGVIPGDVAEAAVRQCEVTQSANVEITPETTQAMIKTFQERWGISQELIEKRIGKRAEAINAAQMLSLRKIAQSLRDGMSKPADWFDIDTAEQPATQTSALTTTLREAPPSPAPVPSPAPAAPSPDTPQSAAVAQTDLAIQEQIRNAPTREALAALVPAIEMFLAAGDNEQFRAEIADNYQTRQRALTTPDDEEIKF